MKKSLKSPRRFVSVTVMLFMFFCIPPVISADTDVTEKIEVVKSRLAYHRREQVSFLDVSLKNISQEALQTPLKAVVENITDPSVTVANADGVTGDGKPYFEYSADSDTLSPGGTTAAKTWKFSDPLRKRFDYTVRVLSSGSSSGISITSPAAGTVISRPDIMVRGTLTDPGNETGVVVNGIPAAVYGNEFAANHVPLKEGQNTITAVATGTDGNTADASAVVNAETEGKYIILSADAESGISPFETTLTLNGTFHIKDPSLTYTGPGQAEITEEPDREYKVRITAEGIYHFTAQVKDTEDRIYTDTIVTEVLNKIGTDALLIAKWHSMREALMQNDMDKAVSYFANSVRDAVREVFVALSEEMRHQMAQDMADIQFIEMTGNSAEYDLRKVMDGRTYSYYLLFIKDTDGLWKIRSF